MPSKYTGPKARIMRSKRSPDRKVVIPKAKPFNWNVRTMTEHERALVTGGDGPVAGVPVRTEEDVNREARKGTPLRIRTTSCGCCTNGCVCWNHQDTPMGRPPRVCDYHREHPHPMVTSQFEERYRILAHRTAGSVAGPAVAWAKRDGEIVEFTTREQAEALARERNDATRSPNVFYTVRKV